MKFFPPVYHPHQVVCDSNTNRAWHHTKYTQQMNQQGNESFLNTTSPRTSRDYDCVRLPSFHLETETCVIQCSIIFSEDRMEMPLMPTSTWTLFRCLHWSPPLPSSPQFNQSSLILEPVYGIFAHFLAVWAVFRIASSRRGLQEKPLRHTWALGLLLSRLSSIPPTSGYII